MSDKLLSRKEAADFLGLSVTTLEAWAVNKRYSLPYCKIGRLVKYRMADLIAFADANVVTPVATNF